MDTLKEAKKVKISCQFGLPSSLLLVSTRALKRGHPDPGFIQTAKGKGQSVGRGMRHTGTTLVQVLGNQCISPQQSKTLVFGDPCAQRQGHTHRYDDDNAPLIFCIYDFHRQLLLSHFTLTQLECPHLVLYQRRDVTNTRPYVLCILGLISLAC